MVEEVIHWAWTQSFMPSQYTFGQPTCIINYLFKFNIIFIIIKLFFMYESHVV